MKETQTAGLRTADHCCSRGMQPWNQPSVRNGFSQQLFVIPFSSRVLRSKGENAFTVQHFQLSILYLVFFQELNRPSSIRNTRLCLHNTSNV